MNWRRLLLALACCPAAWLAGVGAVRAADEYRGLIELDPPGPREFVRDLAHLLRPADEQKIKQLADRLLTDKKTPILVVTINSMAEHGGAKMRIETFALLLFNQWGIGSAQLNGEDWNTGILLLVSKGDRKARIELGGYWRRENDLQCHQIMDQTIIPKFKNGDYSGGILAGVEALDKMARGLQLPHAAAAAPRPAQGAVNSRPANPPLANHPAVNPPFVPPHQAPNFNYPYMPPPQHSPSILPFVVLVIVIGGITLLVALLAGTSIFNAQRRFRSGYYGNDYFGSGPFMHGPFFGPNSSSWFGNSSSGNFGSDFGGSHTSGGHASGGDFGGGGGGSFGASAGGSFDGGTSGGGGATGSW